MRGGVAAAAKRRTVTAPSIRAALNNMKLQLPTDLSPPGGNVDEIDRDALVAGYSSTYFGTTADGLGFFFRTPVNGATTSGSSFPRTEARQVDADGTISGWTPSASYQWVYEADYTVIRLPAGDREVTMFQIHNGDTEVTTIRTTETAGGIRVAVRKNGSTITPYWQTNYQYGTQFRARVEVTDRVKIYYNGALMHDFPFSDLTVASGTFYFKFGNYLQANATTASASDDGEVEIRLPSGRTAFLTGGAI